MAYAASATYKFIKIRNTEPNEILWLPGDPGVTYTAGELVYHNLANAGTAGVLSRATGGSTATCFGVVHKTVVCPAATQAFPIPGKFINDDSAASKCLIPIEMLTPAGLPVFKCTFANHQDEAIATWTAGTYTATFAVGFAADDRPNGGLVYVYEGPGAGEVNVVDDYDHGTLSVVFHRDFNATLTAASKVIILSGEAATYKGVGTALGRIDDADQDTLTCAQGADDGDYVVWCSWQEIAAHLQDLTLPVVRAACFF